MRLLEELHRRSVLRVGSAYVVGAWLVAQVAEFVTETFAAPIWVLQSLVVVLSVALVPVLVFAWMFEFTPQGLRRQSELDRAGVVVARSGRRFDYLIALLLLVAAGWLAISWSQRIRVAQESATAEVATQPVVAMAPANSIAVLPFLNLSKAPDSDVLADGIAEELLGVLGRNHGLRVTARSSAFQFKDQNRDLREVGRLLGVRYVLEGSIRLAAERVRIGAQLIDASNGVQLWSESYDRTLSDLFELQESIAGEVASALQIVITAANDTPQSSGTTSVDAHMELLRALQVGASRRVVDLDSAIAHLRRAIALDPAYAAAHVELASALFIRATQLGDQKSVRAEVAPLLDKALQLNPAFGEALVARGAMLIDDPVVAERTIREGLALAPSYSRGYEALANILGQDPARTGEAMALLDQAIALDPLAPRNHQMKGILVWQSGGDLTAAEPHFLRAVELEPRFRMALVHLSAARMSRGDFAGAIEYGERALAIDPSAQIRENLVHQYLNIGDPKAARRLNEPESLEDTLLILLYEDRLDEAMQRIRAAAQLPSPGGASPVVMAALRDAYAHGRWTENLERVAALLDYKGKLPDEIEGFGFNQAQLAALLRGAGKLDEAERLSDWIFARLDEGERKSPAWMGAPIAWTRAMLHAQAGRDEAALDALEKAFNPRRPYWWCLLDHNPVFEGLRDEPRYKTLRQRLEQDLVAQRALLAAMRKDGRVPDRDAATGG